MIRTRRPTAGGRKGGVIAAQASGVVLYVNASTGSDSNNGRTPTAAKLTLDGARTALNALGGNGVIRVTAASSAPVQGFVDFAAGNVIVEGLNNVPWYCDRTTTIAVGAGGWTSVGGGIYSRSSTSSSALWYVATLADGNGLQTVLTQETGTPTAPSAGEFGYSGSTLYVHLPGDVDPNLHQFKRASTAYLIRASGTAQLTVRDMVGRYSNGNICEVTSANARLTLQDSTIEYANGNCVGDSAAGVLICTNVTARRATNDGFNLNLATVILDNCTGEYNDDEGASPHQTANLTIYGGRYHHNGHGGITAVNSAVMNLYGVTVDYNGATGPSQGERGGINYITTSSGVCQNCICQNNTGEGFNRQSSGTVTITNLTSGLAQGNTLADVLGS